MKKHIYIILGIIAAIIAAVFLSPLKAYKNKQVIIIKNDIPNGIIYNPTVCDPDNVPYIKYVIHWWGQFLKKNNKEINSTNKDEIPYLDLSDITKYITCT